MNRSQKLGVLNLRSRLESSYQSSQKTTIKVADPVVKTIILYPQEVKLPINMIISASMVESFHMIR